MSIKKSEIMNNKEKDSLKNINSYMFGFSKDESLKKNTSNIL